VQARFVVLQHAVLIGKNGLVLVSICARCFLVDLRGTRSGRHMSNDQQPGLKRRLHVKQRAQRRQNTGPDPCRRHLRVLDVIIIIVEKGLADGRKFLVDLASHRVVTFCVRWPMVFSLRLGAGTCLDPDGCHRSRFRVHCILGLHCDDGSPTTFRVRTTAT